MLPSVDRQQLCEGVCYELDVKCPHRHMHLSTCFQLAMLLGAGVVVVVVVEEVGCWWARLEVYGLTPLPACWSVEM